MNEQERKQAIQAIDGIERELEGIFGAIEDSNCRVKKITIDWDTVDDPGNEYIITVNTGEDEPNLEWVRDILTRNGASDRDFCVAAEATFQLNLDHIVMFSICR